MWKMIVKFTSPSNSSLVFYHSTWVHSKALFVHPSASATSGTLCSRSLFYLLQLTLQFQSNKTLLNNFGHDATIREIVSHASPMLRRAVQDWCSRLHNAVINFEVAGNIPKREEFVMQLAIKNMNKLFPFGQFGVLHYRPALNSTVNTHA